MVFTEEDKAFIKILYPIIWTAERIPLQRTKKVEFFPGLDSLIRNLLK